MTTTPRAAIFLNRGAGGAGHQRVERAVELARSALDADLHVTATREPAELEAWLREHLEEYDTAVMVGGDGSLNRFVNVYLNDEDVRFLGGVQTPLTDGDVVTILPAVAGGAPGR